jgi:hypothetical protein
MDPRNDQKLSKTRRVLLSDWTLDYDYAENCDAEPKSARPLGGDGRVAGGRL